MLAPPFGASPPRVLVVEDEPLIGLLLQDMLQDLGYSIVGPITRHEEALAVAREGKIDVAVLDVNLSGKCSTAIADVLADRGIPFLFATGYGGQLPPGYGDVPTLQKPFQRDELGRLLSGLIGSPPARC